MIPIVKQATDADYFAFFGDKIPSWVVWWGGERVALVGFTLRQEDERFWGFFNVKEGLGPRVGMMIVREIQRNFKALTEDVYVTCDDINYENTAPRLLRLWGFKPTDDNYEGMRIWVRSATGED
jgi:hypothetical protein